MYNDISEDIIQTHRWFSVLQVEVYSWSHYKVGFRRKYFSYFDVGYNYCCRYRKTNIIH